MKVKKSTINSAKQNTMQRLGMWALIVSAILLIPFITQAPWTLFDYTFAGVILFSAGAVYQFVTRDMKNVLYRLAAGGAIIFVIILIWGWAVA